MKFYCKRCQSKFDGKYNSLFERLTCPNCKKDEIVLNFIVHGVHPPEDGLEKSYVEFEDVLENYKEKDLKEFFNEEFKLQFSRNGDEFTLLDVNNKKVDLKEVYEKTQKDGKLQRMLYNLYYVMSHGY